MFMQLITTTLSQLEYFFQFQTDEEANQMAAFTSKEPNDREACIQKWTRLLHDPVIHIKTIIVNETIVGSVSKYEMECAPQITYWLNK